MHIHTSIAICRSLSVVAARHCYPLSPPIVTAHCRCLSSPPVVAAHCHCLLSLHIVSIRCCCLLLLLVITACCCCATWLPTRLARHGLPWLHIVAPPPWLHIVAVPPWLHVVAACHHCPPLLPAITVCCCWPLLLSVMRPLEVLQLKWGASALRRLVNQMPSCLLW